MVRLRLIQLGVATLALAGARPAISAPITLTGNVASDFNVSGAVVTPVFTNPSQVGEASFIPANGWVSGWAVKSVDTYYNTSTDTMYVGINTFKNASGATAIVGDADGNGDPGGASKQMASAFGVDTPHLGGQKSVSVAFAPDGPNGPSSPGTPVVVAGVPADKTTVGPGLDGFNVASFKNQSIGTQTIGIENDYGSTLTNNLGTLAFDPSAAHPGFEFTIKNFSKIPGLNPANGFWLELYAGSSSDVIAGEATLPLTRIPLLGPQIIHTPEPATLMTWTLVAGSAALGMRRRVRAGQ